MLWVNFKIYKETFGDGALRLAEACKKVSAKTKIKIIPVVSSLDLYRIKKEIGGEVWLQNINHFLEGQKTGWISALQAVALGAGGALINHSEHKIPKGTILKILSCLKDLKDPISPEPEQARFGTGNFQTMLCFRTKGQAEKWVKKLKNPPDFVAYEPPELIGGEISVSQAKPEVIKRMVEILPKHKIIIGAGIHSKEDVKKALELGAKGVLVSSAVVLSKEPEKKLLELAEGFR